MPSNTDNPAPLNRQRMRRILRERSGITSLEWALVAAAFFLTMLSIFDLARYVVVLQSVATVMSEAGRACAVNSGNCPASGGSNGTWPQLSTIAPMLDPTAFTVMISTDTSGLPGNFPKSNPNQSQKSRTNPMQVTVSYPFTAMTPWMSSLNGTITESATYFYGPPL